MSTPSIQTHPFLEFAIETPSEVVVSIVAGVALQVFNASFAVPFYGIALGCVLTRLTLLLISAKLISSLQEFHEKFAIVPIILILASAILTWVYPVAALVAGLALGIYYGFIAHNNQFFVLQNRDPHQQLGL